MLNFEEFSELYKVESLIILLECDIFWKLDGLQSLMLLLLCMLHFHFLFKELSSDVFEDEYLDDYVKAIFRCDKSHKKSRQYLGTISDGKIAQ